MELEIYIVQSNENDKSKISAQFFTTRKGCQKFHLQGVGAPYLQISDHQVMTVSQTCPTKCSHFAILRFFDILFQL